jgi:hypothetical protein
MCKRSTDDPLVRKFLDDYGVNLLRIPRENARCGDLYVKNGRAVTAPADPRGLLIDPPAELPPVYPDEKLVDLAGAISKKVSFDVGLGLLDGFLAALGAAGVIDTLEAQLEHAHDGGIRFRFRHATRDSVDPGALGNVFYGRRIDTGHPLITAKSEFYVVGGVVRTRSISITLQDNRSQSIGIGADVLHLLSTHADVTAERENTGEITYSGRKPLAIGVELYALRYDAANSRFEMSPAERALALRGRPLPPAPAFPAEDDEALLDIAVS